MSATFWNKRRRERALKKDVPEVNVGNIEPKAEEKQKPKKNGKSGK